MAIQGQDVDRSAETEVVALRLRVEALERELAGARQAEASAHARENRLHTLVVSLTQLAWQSSSDSSSLTDLHALGDFLGQEGERLDERAWLNIVHPDDRPQVEEGLKQALADGTGYTADCRLLRHDGAYLDYMMHCVPFRGADGTVQQWICGCVDITERKRSEASLRVSEERFRTLATYLPVGVFQTDAKGDCIYVNDRWQEITGLTETEALGPNWASTLHPDDRDRVFREWYEAAQAGREFLSEYRFLNRERKLTWVSGSAVALFGESGAPNGYFGTLTDITVRRRADDVLRESLIQKELIRAQEAALAELSTPLIPISEDIVAMPLIGAVDDRRASRVLETLLNGIITTNARVTILDVTGVPTIDTQVANALIRTARAVKLIGAQMVLSGIRPDVAQTLVQLGVDLGGIVTFGTLQTAIAHALKTKADAVGQGQRRASPRAR
jgi:rsbT co-antagonist protein RsbR